MTYQLRHLWLFGIIGQILEVVYLLFDFIKCQRHIGIFVEFERYSRGTAGRSRCHFLEIVDAAQPLLQRVGDAGFDVFGAGPAPDGGDGDLVELEIGEELYIQLLQGDIAG